MLRRIRSRIGWAAVMALLLPATGRAAQRTFVSAGSGSDANPCTRQAPCRQFTAAIAQTDSGGEVVVLDSGGYGPVTIGQSVTVVAPTGIHAAITAFSGNAIFIAGSASSVVIIRGLYLSGLGGENGIDFQNGQTLHVENCVISGFSAEGVHGRAANSDVYIKNTISRQNGAHGFLFISSSLIRASLNSVRAENNSGGIAAHANSRVTVTRGVAAGNANYGFNSSHPTGEINLESCIAAFNGWGLVVQGTGRAANSMFTGNVIGVEASLGGSTISFGNNRVQGNSTDGTFSSTIAQQ